MKKILLILLILSLAGVVIAQSDQPVQQGAEQQQPEKAEQVKKTEPRQQPAADVSDTFIPSEEISEDLAVSFPVDI